MDHATSMVVALVGRGLRAAASRRRDRIVVRPERVATLASRRGQEGGGGGRATSIDKFGRVKCAVLSYLLVAVFLIPVALEASGTFVWLYLALAFGTAGSSTTWVHTTELYSTDIRSTAHTLAFIVGRFGGFASGYVVENANSIPFATTVLIIMAALSALGTLTLRETMGERLS